MLAASAAFIAVAVALGSWIAIGQQRRAGAPGMRTALAHGASALVGFALLLWALATGEPRGIAAGAGAFGLIAAVLLAMAIVPGTALLIGHLRGRGLSGMLIGIHATFAVSGFVILLAYLLV